MDKYKTTLNKILIKNAILGLKPKEVFLPGNNGPYKDPETEVRNKAHLSIILLKAYELTKEKKYKKAAKACLEYLFSKEARPLGFTFYSRKNPKKDKCNGLIGQAWVIEALIRGFNSFKEERYRQLARKVFLMHDFSKMFGYWKRREINGKKLFFDKTFNHQLWFAAAGSMISVDNKDVTGKQINIFMDKLKRNISIRKNGLIMHIIFAKFTTHIYLIKNLIKRSNINKKYMYKKEVGYQAFNLYALALLKQKFPQHSFWKSKKFKKIIDYTLSKEHLEISEKNKYGFSYNPSGIETAFFVYIFKEHFKNYENIIKERLEKQFINHLDKKTFLMNKNTSDPNTLAARIYEATRLPDIKLEF